MISDAARWLPFLLLLPSFFFFLCELVDEDSSGEANADEVAKCLELLGLKVRRAQCNVLLRHVM